MATYYVDLDIAGTSGDGAELTPFSSGAFLAQTDPAGSGALVDEYYLKGSYSQSSDLDIKLFLSINPWNLATYGPWRIQVLDATLRIGDWITGSDWTLDGGILEVSESDGDGLGILNLEIEKETVNCTNMLLNAYVTPTTNSGNDPGPMNMRGCSIRRFLSNTPGVPVINVYDSVIYEESTKGAGTWALVVHLYNTEIPEVDLATFQSHVHRLSADDCTATDCEFSFSSASSMPGYASVQSDFSFDANVSVTGSGNYTAIPTGLFGNSRTTFDSISARNPVGAYYFDLTITTGGVGGTCSTSTMFIAIEDSVHRSIDHGITWVLRGSPVPGSSINGLAGTGNINLIYAAVNDNLYLSKDAGITWTLSGQSPLSPTIFNTIGGCGSVKVLYSAINDTIYRSKDQGSTWEERGIVNAGEVVGGVGSGGNINIVYASINDIIYRSDNAGLDWYLFNTPFPGTSLEGVSGSGNINTLLTATRSGDVVSFYISNNLGNSWELVADINV